MDRSTTPRVSQLAQGGRQKSRSQSGSEELKDAIDPSRSSSHSMGLSTPSSSSSGIATPVTGAVPDRMNTPGVLNWVRSALLMGSPGRGTYNASAAAATGDHSAPVKGSPQMPGSISVPHRPVPYVKVDGLASDEPRRSLHSKADQSRWNPLDWSQRRSSSISTAVTIDDDDDDAQSSSSDEDVYAPFTSREEDASSAAKTDTRLENEEEALSLPPASIAKETAFSVSNITHRFSSHLNIYQAQDSNQFVQDTTSPAHHMPDLILTPPDSSYRGASPAGWMESSSQAGRPGIDRRSSHNKTPTPGNILGRTDMAGIESTDSSNSFLSAEVAEGSTPDGDGEDLEDLLGRPRSPEELAKNRPSRETVVLGSRGASRRAGKPLEIDVAGRGGASADQEYWSATSPMSPPINTPTDSPSLARAVLDRRTASEGVAAAQPGHSGSSGSTIVTQTASPQPRRAMNFFTRRRESSLGGKGASEGDKQEASKKEATTGNPAFWRLGKRQSNLASSAGAERVAEEEQSDSVQLEQVDKLAVQSPAVRISHDSDLSNESATPSKASSGRAISSEAVAKGACSRKKEGLALLTPSMQPRLVKVRRLKKTTKDRDFARVYLAQELFLNSSAGEDAAALLEADPKPSLTHLDSSTSVASSLASSSTSCSKGSAPASAKRKATWAMKFSLDGKHLAVAGQDAVIRVYAVLDSEAARKKVEMEAAAATDSLLTLPGYHDYGSTCSINSLGKNSLGRKSFSAKESGAKVVLPLPNLAVFRPNPVREFKGHTNDILDLNWSKGGFLLSASMDKTARVWHLSHANSLVSFVHGDFVTSAVFHPRDDRFFLSGSLDGKLRLWNISAKKVQSSQEVPGLITACAFTESGNTACVGTFAGHALFYQTEGLTYSSSIAVRSPSGKHAKGGRKITSIEPLLSLPASSTNRTGNERSQGERILITSNDSRIRAYDLRNKSMIARFKAKTYSNRTSQIRANVSDDNVFIVAGSEATYNEGGQVHIWNASHHLLDTTGHKKLLSKTSTKALPSSLSTDFNVESFSAHSGTVTCAIMAPLSTNGHLKASNDYLLQESDRRLANNPKLSPSASISSALSNAVQYPMKLATGNYEADTRRLNRIIVSVDENAVVRVFRSDSLSTVEG